jgi:hypothetical protein
MSTVLYVSTVGYGPEQRTRIFSSQDEITFNRPRSVYCRTETLKDSIYRISILRTSQRDAANIVGEILTKNAGTRINALRKFRV